MKIRFSLLAGALLAALPLAALLPGCGGGGGGSNSSNATATPSATTTATPSATAASTATPSATAMPNSTYNLTSAAGDDASALGYYQSAISGGLTVSRKKTTFSLSTSLRTGSGGAHADLTTQTFEFALNGSTDLKVGNRFVVGGTTPTATVAVTYLRYGGASPNTFNYYYPYTGTSGTLTITALSASSITVRFDKVAVTRNTTSLTLSGTVVSKLP